MFTINLVNALQIFTLAISSFSLVLMYRLTVLRQLCYFLILVIVSTSLNLMEEVFNLREFYLVTPIFIFGFGPAMYLCVLSVLGVSTTNKHQLHFIPMIAILPFTAYTDVVIFLGTLVHIGYFFLTLKAAYQFHGNALQWRSNANDLSFKWLFWSLVVLTISSALNLVRLNFQKELGPQFNMLGQGISTFIGLGFIVVLISQLMFHKERILSLIANAPNNTNFEKFNVQKCNIQDAEEQQYFQMVFRHIRQQLIETKSFTQQNLTLDNVSKLTGFNTRDISRAVNLNAQENFNDFINRFRVEFAVEKMKTSPELSITEISIDAGFGSKSTFNHSFRRIHNTTPSDFKKRVQEIGRASCRERVCMFV